MIKVIDASNANQDMEVVSHIINKLPKECLEVVTTIEGIDDLTLSNIMAKL